MTNTEQIEKPLLKYAKWLAVALINSTPALLIAVVVACLMSMTLSLRNISRTQGAALCIDAIRAGVLRQDLPEPCQRLLSNNTNKGGE